MKCFTCTTELSPNFVSAIVDNRCPACGKAILEISEYKKVFSLKKTLGGLGLGLSEPLLVRLASTINANFELVPRAGSPPMVVEAPQDVALPAETKRQPDSLKKLNSIYESLIEGEDSLEADEVSEDDDEPSDEEAKMLAAEWGIGIDIPSMPLLEKGDSIPAELQSIFDTADFGQPEDTHSVTPKPAKRYGGTNKPVRRVK